MDQNQADVSHTMQSDSGTIDAWLKSLWDRARKAAELISRLRVEKAELQSKVASLEEELGRAKNELAKNEGKMRSLANENQGDNRSFMSNGDREQLSARVKELLAKLDGYI